MDQRYRNFGFVLKDLSRRYVTRFEKRAQEFSLTLAQCKALIRLHKNEGVSQARLADLADLDPMTMVRILDRMERDGLLERRPDPVDRRARSLYLTPKAQPMLDEIEQVSELTRNEAFVGINRRERQVFLSVLERIHANVTALENAPVTAQEPATRIRDAR